MPIGSPTNSTTTSLSTNDHTKDSLFASNSPSSTNNNATTRATEAPPKQRSKNGYVARVGFDTLGCDTPAEYAFTLQARTDGWRRTRRSRTFLVGTDLNEYSSHALQWVMENMVEDGDEIVALRVVPIELRDSFAKSGIPSFQGQEVAARSEATKIMDMIREKNKSKQKQINIVVEYVVGSVRDTIQHMIKMYEPSMLVVGTRGRSSVKGFLLGSVSRYLLNHSPVPVTVVRPASKLIKSKTKAKGIFRRRSSAVGFESGEDQPQAPQLFYSSPLSRQTSRTSVDEGNNNSLGGGSRRNSAVEVERVRSRSPEPSHHYAPTAAARASAAKRPSKGSIFAPMVVNTNLTPPSPSASMVSSLSFASAMLSDTGDEGNKKPPPPPEGMLQLRKSVTTDGTSGSTSSSSSSSKKSGRRSMAFLWAPLSLGKEKKKRASEV
ncbi:hypothetical protein BGX29_000380 [Mortierella sp. GBA35]|nr:hypothetical protein BGX29_000380 [Mortierella sp. GBA35]KAF9091714.1 hypothetical protein BGX23_004905 [Mortierella sp. AD031]KAG0217590.1 hypothetical protein BGX33_010107 [Mortierella sp. NVP41]